MIGVPLQQRDFAWIAYNAIDAAPLIENDLMN